MSYVLTPRGKKKSKREKEGIRSKKKKRRNQQGSARDSMLQNCHALFLLVAYMARFQYLK